MQSFIFNRQLTLLTILYISTHTLAQLDTSGRNLTIPNPTTSASSNQQTTTPNARNATATSNNTTSNANNTTMAKNNSTNQNSSSTTPTKLTPIPDATGTAGQVPVPAASGGKANHLYGPDDSYISGFPKLAIHLTSTLLIGVSSVAALVNGAIL